MLIGLGNGPFVALSWLPSLSDVPWRRVGYITMCSLMYATMETWTWRYFLQIFA